jgi:hypothetical protein
VTLSKQDILRLVMEGFGVSEEYTTAEIISTISQLLTPPEPRWHAAVVEDVDGYLWINNGGTSNWWQLSSDDKCSWDWLNKSHGPVNILFRGIERP